MKVGMKELREKQKEVFAAVAKGEHVVVMKDNVTVGGIVPAFEMAMLECLTEEEWRWLKSIQEGTERSLLPPGTLVPQAGEESVLQGEGAASSPGGGRTTGPSVVPDTATPMRPKSHAPVPGLKRAIDLLPVSEDVPPPGFPCGYQVRSGNCGQQATSYFGPQGRCDEHRGR